MQFYQKVWFLPSKEKQVQGILLQSKPYLDRGAILQVFTPEGLFPLFHKRRKKEPTYMSHPFCVSELLLKKNLSNLDSIIDHQVLDWNFPLRSSLANLQSAGKMAKNIIASQIGVKPAPLLYALFKSYLQKIPLFTHPEILAQSFALKLQIHEGTLHISPRCAFCTEPSSHVENGQSVCRKHAKRKDLPTTNWNTVLLLALAKRFQELKALDEDKRVATTVQALQGFFLDSEA